MVKLASVGDLKNYLFFNINDDLSRLFKETKTALLRNALKHHCKNFTKKQIWDSKGGGGGVEQELWA